MSKTACAVALFALASIASASSHQHYRRVDVESETKARAWLDAHELSGVSARVFRGRLTLGALPAGADVALLERELVRVANVASVHR